MTTPLLKSMWILSSNVSKIMARPAGRCFQAAERRCMPAAAAKRRAARCGGNAPAPPGILAPEVAAFKGRSSPMAPPRAARKPLLIGRADRPERGARRGAACDPHRPIVNHLANHPRPDGYTRQVGATRDVRSLMSQHLRKTPEKSIGLCPYPFPFQIWFDGDAVRARSASRRKRGGS